MRKLALAMATFLALAVVSPAFAQPFADVPTDHWAFDAIAELAAKGIIEGFPDGTFKGERGVTRYEVAILLARILARIEAIKIPAPAAAPRPEVTRVDVQTIQRLVNEFRAELAALGVRTTAVEEELNALKARTSNVTIKGDQRLRYNFKTTPGVGSPNTGFASVQYRHRITLTGKTPGGVSVTTRIRTGSATFGSQISPLQSTGAFLPITFDYAYTDVSAFGFSWRLGQQAYTLGGSGWSGYGLLYDPSNAGVFSATGAVGGAKISGNLLGFNTEFGAFAESSTAGFNIYTVSLDLGSLLPGWSLKAYGLYQARNSAVPLPATAAGSTSGTTTLAASATTPNTNDTGYEAILTGALFPGLTLGADYAGFNPGSTGAASSNAYIAWVTLDLSTMGMAGLSPTLTGWYKNYGSTSPVQMPFHSGASTETGDYAAVTWNFNGWGAALAMNFGSGLTATFPYESGNQTVTDGSSDTEYYASLGYALASGTTLSFNYFKWSLGGVDQDNFYRIQLTTSY
jgi:hypothetical protein